jgi:hypothetical protein
VAVADRRERRGRKKGVGGGGSAKREASKGELGADVEDRARRIAEAATRSAARLVARTREELEDIWAEARDRRKGR